MKAIKLFALGSCLGGIIVILDCLLVPILIRYYNPHLLRLGRGDITSLLPFPGVILVIPYAVGLGGYLAARIGASTMTFRSVRYSLLYLVCGIGLVISSVWVALAAGNWDLWLGGLLVSWVSGIVIAEGMIWFQGSGDTHN
jgi:hypothetical protein